jgi:outer membrane protein OmpA-like peptidoglycan-associated protein
MIHGKFTKYAILTAIITAAAGLAACTTNPYTGEKEASNTAKGAGIGALGGAVISAMTGGDRKNILLGAGIGAIAGGGVGYYMDQQENKLRDQLQNTGVSVTRDGDNIVLNMPGNITFATNSSDISADFYQVLDSVALVINEYEKTYVDVTGHTDSTGSDSHNMQLSIARATSVGQYLKSRKVLPERVSTTGMGESQPVATNDTPEGRALNRRVEIVLTPLT